MIEPVDFLLYLYYECSDCGNIGDEMRLNEVQTWQKHVCKICGNIDELKPIPKVQFATNKSVAVAPSTKGKPRKQSATRKPMKQSLPKHYRPVYRQCVALGFNKHAVKEHMLEYIYNFPDAPLEDVFKKVVGEFA